MKKSELEQKLTDIHQKITSLESLDQRLASSQQILDKVQTEQVQAEEKNKQITNLLETSLSKKPEFDNFFVLLQQGAKEAEEYKAVILKQKEENGRLTAEVEGMKKNCEELVELSKNQLGFVSMETLANSFSREADKLEKSTKKWYWWIFGATVVLVFAVFGVAIWQVYKDQTLLKPSFAIRLPLVSPIIYFLLFAHHQFSRDKRLWEEYSFKASIARSFEAYRKVIKEEINQPQDQPEKTKFVLDTIRGVYSSPMINIVNNKEMDGNGNNFDVIDKFVDAGKKVKDFFLKQ